MCTCEYGMFVCDEHFPKGFMWYSSTTVQSKGWLGEGTNCSRGSMRRHHQMNLPFCSLCIYGGGEFQDLKNIIFSSNSSLSKSWKPNSTRKHAFLGLLATPLVSQWGALCKSVSAPVAVIRQAIPTKYLQLESPFLTQLFLALSSSLNRGEGGSRWCPFYFFAACLAAVALSRVAQIAQRHIVLKALWST